MSKQLLQTDYISVFGEIRDGEVTPETCKEKEQFIKLFFTIQVNGKIKTVQHIFLLEKSDFNDSGLSLRNWNEWYKVHQTLKDLGYPMGDESDPVENGAGIIYSWISTLLK